MLQKLLSSQQKILKEILMIDASITLSIIFVIAAIGMISILIDMTKNDDEIVVIKKQPQRKEFTDDFEVVSDLFDN